MTSASIAVSPRTNPKQDLGVNELTLRRFSSSITSSSVASPSIGDDTADMNARGKDLALRCWNEDEEFLAKDKIAEWLGGK
jgi:PH/SEC7 domain-containing protein